MPWLESIGRDARYGARQLRRSPGFAAAAIGALAIGIGANAAVFTLVNAVLLRGLPFAEPDRIMSVWTESANGDRLAVSREDFEDLRQKSTTSFSQLVGSVATSINVSDDETVAERVQGVYVSWDLFRLLGVQPSLGRDFREEDDQREAEPVVIVSHGLWQSRYGGTAAVLGRTVRVNSRDATIIGVMPRGMGFPGNATVWIPRMMLPRDSVRGRAQRNLQVMGRLAPGVSEAQARAEVRAVAARLAAIYPASNKDLTFNLSSYQEATTSRQTRLIFVTFMGAVGFVLLIACANVANLLLARSIGRSREVAMRVALGAGRWRVVRQLLVESVLVASIGGVLGLLLAMAAVRSFDRASVMQNLPYGAAFTFDPIVFVFVGGLCLLTGIVFGLAPALHVSKTDVNDVLKEGKGGGVRSRRWAETLIVGELALTFVLLSGAGFMMRSFLSMYRMELGFDPSDLKVMRLYLPLTKYTLSDPHRVIDLEQRLADRLEEVSEFRAASLVTSPPTVGTIRGDGTGVDARPIAIDGDLPSPGESPTLATLVGVGDDYFEAVRIPILSGRAFNRSDGLHDEVATSIVNQRFAELHFANQDPIGHEVLVFGGGWHRTRVIGVVPNVRQGNLERAVPDPVIYVPMRTDSRPGVIGVVVRAPGSAASVAARVRKELAVLDPDIPVFNVQTMDEVLAGQRGQSVVFLWMFGTFAAMALLLSAVGLYGVTAHAVTQRTREIGVRMALGARSQQVIWLMVRGGLVHLAIGLTIGIAGALAMSRVFASLLVRTNARDPTTLVGTALLLTAVALLACAWPARYAARLDPLRALHRD